MNYKSYITPPLYRDTTARRLNTPVAGAHRLRGGRVRVAPSGSPRDPAAPGRRDDAVLPPSSSRRRRPGLPVPVSGAHTAATVPVEPHSAWSARRVETSRRFILSVPKVPAVAAGPDPTCSHIGHVGADQPKPGSSTTAPSPRRGFRAGGVHLTSKSKGQKGAASRPGHPAGTANTVTKQQAEWVDQAIAGTLWGPPHFGAVEDRTVLGFFMEDRTRVEDSRVVQPNV